MINEINRNNRNTIYLDESGVSSLNDAGKQFILTGVVANNSKFHLLSEYYSRLKYKYFKSEAKIHSIDLFWKPNKRTKLFIEEIENYLDTISFGFITVIVDKAKVKAQVAQTKIKRPYQTNLTEAKSIWQRSGKTLESFEKATVKEVINEIRSVEISDINNYYPLKIAYRTLLDKYLFDYSVKIGKGDNEFEICFETSPNRERIIKYTEDFYDERVRKGGARTKFSIALKDRVYSISFPNKSAKYLGLEVADIISYGFNLSKSKRLGSVPAYAPIWESINKKRIEMKNFAGVECVYKIPE